MIMLKCCLIVIKKIYLFKQVKWIDKVDGFYFFKWILMIFLLSVMNFID